MQEGLIIGSIDYKEKSKIIYLLTENGKDSLLVHKAKDIKSENNNLTQNLNKVRFEKTGKGSLAVATLLEIENYNYSVKEDLKKYACISYVLEIVNNHLPLSTNYALLYNLLNKFIEELTLRDDYLMMLLEMKIKLLYFLGINPNFYACHHCGTTKELVGLSLINGSVECFKHVSADNVGSDITKIIELLYKDKSLEIKLDDIDTVKYLYSVIDKYYEWHLDITFKSEKMLKQLNII